MMDSSSLCVSLAGIPAGFEVRKKDYCNLPQIQIKHAGGLLFDQQFKRLAMDENPMYPVEHQKIVLIPEIS